MTYISTSALTTASRQAVMGAQSQLAKLQSELSSGTYADVGLQVGSRSGQLVSLTTQKNELQAITDDNALTATRMSTSQTVLSTLQKTASAFLATLTQAQSAGNATQGLQDTASGDLAALTAGLNTAVGDQHVFAGLDTQTAPMTTYAAGSANKAAVDGAFQTAFGFGQTDAAAGSISGSDMQTFLDAQFAPLFSGSSYAADWSSASSQTITSRIAPEQSVTTSVSANAPAFQALAQAYTMVKEFGGPPMSADASQAAITTATNLVTGAISSLVTVQAGLGVSQSAMSAANDSMSAQINLLTAQAGTLSQLSDTDTYDISNQVSTLQTQIQASYEVTAKLQQMSLANYLT